MDSPACLSSFSIAYCKAAEREELGHGPRDRGQMVAVQYARTSSQVTRFPEPAAFSLDSF